MEGQARPDVEYEDEGPKSAEYVRYEPETASDRFVRTYKKHPALSLGIGAGLVSLLFMISQFKNRPEGRRLSLQVIHTRMAVQGTIVAILTAGMAHDLYQLRLIFFRISSENRTT